MRRTEWKTKDGGKEMMRHAALSREGVRIERELRLRVVLPHVFSIEETPEPCDLRRQVYHDDLHLDVEL